MESKDDFLISDPNPSSSLSHSPLAFPPSHNLQESLSSSSNKENINSKNVELGIKPLQMKTRKNYNLRKSLTWDAAFSTDEGILDPLELTLITGVNPNSYVPELPTITELGLNESSPLKRTINNRDKVTNKLLSINQNINRSGSKAGVCLKTLSESSSSSSSSLKRPANSNTLKTAKKEAKLPKLPISKRQSCFSAMTKGSLAPNQLRHNMIPKPSTNVQKNVELKSFGKNVNDSQSKAKTSSGSLRLPAKELPQKTVRSLTSSSKVASSTKLRFVQLDKAGYGSEVVPDRLKFCEFREEYASIAAKNLVQNTAANSNKLLTEAARLSSLGPCHNQRAYNELMISDRMHPRESQEGPAAPQHINLHNSPINQPARPSGLRMPSPSLRFFDQRTALESGSLLQKKTGSNRKIGEGRPPAEPRRTLMKRNDITEKAPSNLSTPCASIHLSPSPSFMANISDTKDKFVHQYEVNRPQNHIAIPVSTSRQSIKHQEQNFSTVVDNSLESYPESNLDAIRLDAEDQVFLESQKDGIVKREDEVGLGLENYSNLMKLEYLGQEKNAAKVVDHSSLCLEDDARFNTDSTCSGNSDGIELKGIATQKCFDACVSALVNTQFHSKGQSLNCIAPAQSSELEKGPCASATEIEDDMFQEDSGLNYTSPILLDISEKKQVGLDVTLNPREPLQEAQLEFREISPLTDDHNQSGLSHPRPVVELPTVIASVDDDAFLKTESPLQVAQCASTYPQSLEKEIHEDIQKSREMGINILSSLDKSVLDEKSQSSCGNILEANPTVEECTRESISYIPLQSESQTLEGFGTTSNFSKIHVKDAQLQLLENDKLDHSCGRLTSELHNHSVQDVDHDDIFGNQPEVSNTAIDLEVVSESNHQLLANTDKIGRSDIYVCDLKPFNAPRGGKEIWLYPNDNDKLCGNYGTSGSRVIDSTGDHNEKSVDTYNTEFPDPTVPSNLESSDIDEMVGVKTCTAYYSASFQREVADSMLEEKRIMFGALSDIGQISVDNNQTVMKYKLSPEKIANLDEPDDALYSVIVVPEQSSHASDLQNSYVDAQSFQGNVSDLVGDDQPIELQDCFGIMPLMESYNYFPNDMESCGQHPSECNSSFPVSHQPTAGVETSSTVCSVTAELCQVEESLLISTYRIGADGSNIRFGQQVEAEVVEEEKSPMVDELHHELDNGRNLKENKEATVLNNRSNNISRQDNSLVIHPPNAVPFSDEWLAAIEAAGEEILTMKCGAVQHSPPDKSLPEPSPWSPVKKKANQIGPYDCTKYTNALPSNPNSSD